MIDSGGNGNYCRSVMKTTIRKLSWFLGALGLLGMILQSLQVQVEHTHSNGRTPHSHSHRHSHSHSHGHSHGHSHDHHHHGSQSTELPNASANAPQTHIHVTLLWWEFTLNLDSNNRRQPSVPTEVAEQIHSHPPESPNPRDTGPALIHSPKTHGPLIGAPHWSQLISEWYSAWHSVLPPSKNRLPNQQGHLGAVTPAASCYQSLHESPPVPPPEVSLSVSFA